MHILKFPWLTHTEEKRKFEVYSVSVAPDGKRLASGGLDGKIRIWLIDTLIDYKNKLVDLEFQQQDKENANTNTNNSINNDIKGNNSNKIELDNRTCRPLCSMGRHTGAVTCVRFSPTGRFLASGSDDKILLIWEKDEEKTRIMTQNMEQRLQFGSDNIENADLEHWTVRKRLVAHDNDIQDMAWAPDSSILVTVGLDRSIIVWSGLTFEKIKRFDIHQSHVKGVVFDPANKYFATYSDDRTLRVFRYHKTSPTEMSFSIESVIVDPFKKTPLTTYFRRCSWSPDGQHIAAPNASNGGLSSVAIINRGSWESDVSLIGHDLPCEVTSFSPRLYEIEGDNDNKNKESTKRSSKDNEQKISTVLATAGQDRTLAIWNTSTSTPLVVANDICLKTITDLSWNPNGDILFISSLDGSITTMFFDKNEIGKPIPLEKNDVQLHRYGADRESMIFPESVEQLKLEEKADFVFKTDPIKKLDRLMEESGSTTGFNTSKQKGSEELKASVPPTVNTLIPRSKKHPNKQLPSVPLQSLKDSKPSSTGTPSISSTSTATATATLAPHPPIMTSTKANNVLNVSSQKVTITKSGKKRVAPILISSSSTDSSGSSLSTNVIKPVSGTTTEIKKREKRLQTHLSTPSYKLPRLGLQALVTSIRDNLVFERYQDDSNGNENSIDHIAENNITNNSGSNKNGKKKTILKRSSTLANSNLGGSSCKRKKDNDYYPSYLSSSLTLSNSNLFADLKIQPNILLDFKDDDPYSGEVLEVRNHLDDDDDDNHNNDSGANEFDEFNEFNSISKAFVPELIADMKKTDDKEKSEFRYKFELFKNYKFTNVCNSSYSNINKQLVHYWCLSTEIGSIIFLSDQGRQLRPSIELGNNIIQLIPKNEYILSLDSNGLINVWNLKLNINLMSNVSLATILQDFTKFEIEQSTSNKKRKFEISEIKVKSIEINELTGLPIVVLTNNMIYTYSSNLCCWLNLFDTWYFRYLQPEELNDLKKTMFKDNKLFKILITRLIKSLKTDTDNNDLKLDDKTVTHIKSTFNQLIQCTLTDL